MCLAVPGQVLDVSNGRGRVNLHGNLVPVSLVLVPDARPDDWVLVHAGFAIQRIDEDEAAETFRILSDLTKAHDAALAQSSSHSPAEAPHGH